MAQKEYGLSLAAARLMMEILQKREKPDDIPSRDTLYQQVRKRLDRIPRQHKQYKVHNGSLYVEDERTKILKRVLVKEDEPLAIWEAHIETLENGTKVHHCAHATYRRLKQHWMGGSRRKCDPLRFCAACRKQSPHVVFTYDPSVQDPASQTPSLHSQQIENTPEPDGFLDIKGTWVIYVLLLDDRILWLYNAQTRWLRARPLVKAPPVSPVSRMQDFMDMMDEIRTSAHGLPPCLVVQQSQSFPWSIEEMRKICPVHDLPKHHDLCQQAVDAVTATRRELTAFSITDAVKKYNDSLSTDAPRECEQALSTSLS